MTEREEFEAWVDSCVESEVGTRQALTTGDDGYYGTPWVSHCWMAWQAAKAQDRDVMNQALQALESLFTVDGVGIWKLGGQSLPKNAIAELKKALGKS